MGDTVKWNGCEYSRKYVEREKELIKKGWSKGRCAGCSIFTKGKYQVWRLEKEWVVSATSHDPIVFFFAVTNEEIQKIVYRGRSSRECREWADEMLVVKEGE